MNRLQETPSEALEVVAAADVIMPAPQPEIRLQQVDLIFTQPPAALGAAFIVAVLLTASLWGVADQSGLLAWLGAQLLLTGSRLWHVYRYRIADQEERKDPQWEKLFLVGTLVSGITWGCVSLVYSHNWDVHYQVFVVICIIGLQAGAVSAYSADTEADKKSEK